jgi:tetratricopeptide (TPR) repeat protein
MRALCIALLLIVPRAVADNTAEAMLGEDADLLRHHRGYLAWMADHPEAAAREEAYLGLMTVRAFRDVLIPFDEALVASPVAARAFDTFYTHLSENPDARDRVERLARVAMSAPESIPGRQTAMTWMQANPDEARRFLQDPVLLTPTPEALAPLRNVMREYPDWWSLLQDAFAEVEAAPEMYDRILPWWRRALELDAEQAEAHGRLAVHLARYPNRFWVWHRREVTLAQDAQARNWIRYWHRLLRRSDVDLPAYYRAVRSWVSGGVPPEEAGDPWPPKADPPALSTYKVTAPVNDDHPERPARPRLTRPEMKRPERPGIAYPTRPEGPARPTRPEVKAPSATPRGN